jgi:hypothetical protein
MARQPTLRKNAVNDRVYWFTKAGGDTYFGRVVEMTARDAKKAFAAHLSKLLEDTATSKGTVLTAGELMGLFLDWVKRKRATGWRRWTRSGKPSRGAGRAKGTTNRRLQ